MDAATFERHAHATYTVATVLSGSLTANVGEEKIDVAAGGSLLINPQEAHETHTDECEVVSVALSPVLVDELLTKLGWHHPDAYAAFQATTTDDDTITSLARALASEVAEERPGQALMLDALVRQLVMHLLRSHFVIRRNPTIELSRAGPVDRRLRRAVELVHTRFAEDVSLKEMADAVYLSEYHFARLFKTVTGFTPHGYLANVRIEQARKLLADTRLPIMQIARRVGYRSPSHFAHAFKATTGVSPTVFRAGLSPAGVPFSTTSAIDRSPPP